MLLGNYKRHTQNAAWCTDHSLCEKKLKRWGRDRPHRACGSFEDLEPCPEDYRRSVWVLNKMMCQKLLFQKIPVYRAAVKQNSL